MNNKQLARMRELYGYSLRELADEAGLSHMMIKHIEDGARGLQPDTEKKIVSAMYRLNEKRARQRRKAEKQEAEKVVDNG